MEYIFPKTTANEVSFNKQCMAEQQGSDFFGMLIET